MNLKRLTTHNQDEFEPAMALYRASFPAHEQREPLSQISILGSEAYHFDLIYDGGVWVGMLLSWETDAYFYVEHFCILPQMRSRRYGEKALALLRERGKPILLEIDPPEDEVSIRRKAFYERSGYRANPYDHVHPPYHKELDGHRLVVMSCPDPLSQEEYDAFFHHLNKVVMGN